MDGTDSASNTIKRSCSFCKRRKIKCNRGNPCASCIKFKNSNCVYVPPKTTKPKVQKNIKRSLEQEVLQLRTKVKHLEQEVESRSHINGDTNSSYSFNRLTQDDRYDLNNAEHAQYDKSFQDLLNLIEEHDCDDIFNLFEDGAAVLDTEPLRRRHYGIFSWKSSSILDPALKRLGKHAKRKLAKGELMGFLAGGGTEVDVDNSTRVQNIVGDVVHPLNIDFNLGVVKDGVPCNNVKSGSSSKRQKVAGVRPLMILRKYQTGSTTEISTSDQLALKKSIEEFLPIKDMIWKFVDVFFNELYIFLPIIDESDFRGHIIRILEKGEMNEKCPDLNTNNKSDFSHLGVLLFVLRLSYLSLLPTTSMSIKKMNKAWQKKSPEKKALIDSPINLEAVSLAHECVNLFNLFGPVNLSTFQLLMVTRMYSIYGPEGGDGPDYGDASLLNSVLFQVAYALGLHRDPDSCNTYTDEKKKNLIRKTWSLLVLIDLTHSMSFGDPLNVNKYSYDTKLPTHNKENSNLLNLNHEKDVVGWFNFMTICFKPLSSLVTELCDVNAKIRVTALCKKLRYLRFKLFEEDGLVLELAPQLISDDPLIIHATKFRIQFSFSYFICSIYFHLFLHFEKRNAFDVAFYYLSNLTQKILLVLFPYYYNIKAGDTESSGADFILVPGLESMLHKSMLFIMSMILRIKFQTQRLISRYDHEGLMNSDLKYRTKFIHLLELQEKFGEINNIFFTIADAFSQKYFYSWIVSRFNKFLATIIASEEFVSHVYDKEVAFPIFDSDERISKLISIIDLCLESKKKNVPSKVFSFQRIQGSTKNEDFNTEDQSVDGVGIPAETPGLTPMSTVNAPQMDIDFTVPSPVYRNLKFEPNPFSNLNTDDSLSAGNTNFSTESGGGDSTSSENGSGTLGHVNPEDIDNIWLQLLGKGPQVGDENYYGDIPQINYMFPDPPQNIGPQDQTQNPDTGGFSGVDSVLYEELFKGL